MKTRQDLCRETTSRLDDLEHSLPEVPARVVAFGRASTHRVVDTASGVASDVARQFAQLGSTATSAWATTVGQAKSAVDRTSATASRTASEAVGQARAQGRRTTEQAERTTTALLDDATRAVDPDNAGRPAALENWTKAELYERAQELDLDGRSSMSKSQLVAAIRSA